VCPAYRVRPGDRAAVTLTGVGTVTAPTTGE